MKDTFTAWVTDGMRSIKKVTARRYATASIEWVNRQNCTCYAWTEGVGWHRTEEAAFEAWRAARARRVTSIQSQLVKALAAKLEVRDLTRGEQ